MPRDVRLMVSRLWRPTGLAPSDPRLASFRLQLARLAAIAVELFCFFVLLPVLLAARFVFRLPVPGGLLVAALVAAVAAGGAIQAIGLWDLLRLGRWRALDGRIMLRADHPRAYSGWVFTHTVVAAVWFAAAAVLAWGLPH